ncbi:hypothetical protein [Amycolatopsis anabasis]|uniref:hypothetical protein n=1 Tax=Amycolatopsis anabasis TaxID=1840409 RepID=UPI00131E3F74|nr:hypothetical protein [Amycolatopsis anabasis]
MDPRVLLQLFGLLGDTAGAQVGEAASSLFELAMRLIWDAALFILREAFKLADQFSIFTVSTTEGPVSVLWPLVLWISGVLALGLFFWQIIITVLRGGRGFTRLVAGPFQYGAALALTVGLVAAFLASADGLTTAILDYSLHARNFQDALNATGFADAVSDGVKAVVLGIAGIVGVVPAGIGYVIEMLFREAAIYVLVATSPLAAAGLLANVTAPWFWRTARWLLATIAMKPVLAFTLVLGIAIMGGAQGVSGLLAGVGVLLVSLVVPFVLFKLFAFIDPNTEAGQAFRDQLSNAGLDSYGTDSPSGKAAQWAWNKKFGKKDDEDDEDGGGSDQEQANTDRFDHAVGDEAEESMDQTGVGDTDDTSDGDGGGGGEGDGDNSEEADDSSPPDGAEAADDGEEPEPPGAAEGDGSDGGGGGGDDDDPPDPEPPDGGGGPPPPPPDGGGPKPGGGGGAAASDEAAMEEAAVVV